jgi:hypothetical protein
VSRRGEEARGGSEVLVLGRRARSAERGVWGEQSVSGAESGDDVKETVVVVVVVVLNGVSCAMYINLPLRTRRSDAVTWCSD